MFKRRLGPTTIAIILAALSSLHGNTQNVGSSSNDASVQDALVAIANDFMVAWQKQDMATISNILAPDFLFAGPRGVKSRAYTLNVLNHCTLGKFTLEDFQMRQISADSAVLLYEIHRDLSCFGRKDLENTLNTDTFVRRDGKWSIVLTTEGELGTAH